MSNHAAETPATVQDLAGIVTMNYSRIFKSQFQLLIGICWVCCKYVTRIWTRPRRLPLTMKGRHYITVTEYIVEEKPSVFSGSTEDLQKGWQNTDWPDQNICVIKMLWSWKLCYPLMLRYWHAYIGWLFSCWAHYLPWARWPVWVCAFLHSGLFGC